MVEMTKMFVDVMDKVRFDLIDTLNNYRRDYLDLMSDTLGKYLKMKLHNTSTDTNGWLELVEDVNNVIHPYSVRFVPEKTNGSRSNVKRIVKGYDQIDTIQNRIQYILENFMILD